MTKKRGLGSGFGGLITQISAETSARLEEVPLSAIVPNPHQPRVVFDQTALNELAASIKEHGLLQPLVVTRLDNGRYQLIAGERRLRAARQAELETVPVVVKDVAAQKQLELALIENIQRADLDPIEEARAYAMLEDQFGLTHEMIAHQVGKSRVTISETLALLKLPVEVQTLVSGGRLTPGHARVLAKLHNAQREIAAAQHIVDAGLSVRRAEEYVAQLTGAARPKPAAGKEIAPASHDSRSAATIEDETVVKELEGQLGLRVQLIRSGAGGRLIIHFDNEEMLSGLYDRLTAL